MGDVLEAALKRDFRDIQLGAAQQSRRIFEAFPQQLFAGGLLKVRLKIAFER